MKGFGILLVAIGIIWGLVAFNLGISVQEVVNIGLVNRKSTQLFGAGITLLSGILLFGFGSVVEAIGKLRENNLGGSAEVSPSSTEPAVRDAGQQARSGHRS